MENSIVEFADFNTYFINEENKRIVLNGKKTFTHLQYIKKTCKKINHYKYKNYLLNLKYKTILDLSFYNSQY